VISPITANVALLGNKIDKKDMYFIAWPITFSQIWGLDCALFAICSSIIDNSDVSCLTVLTHEEIGQELGGN